MLQEIFCSFNRGFSKAVRPGVVRAAEPVNDVVGVAEVAERAPELGPTVREHHAAEAEAVQNLGKLLEDGSGG